MWGTRAELLGGIVKLILKVKGPGAGELEKFYGTSKRITALAPAGAKFLSGLLRRPVFVAGEAPIKAVAVNAWQWAEENKEKQLSCITFPTATSNEGSSRPKERRIG